MEFLLQNLYDTTTSIVVNNNTVASEFLMSSDVRQQFVSSGLNDDTQTLQIKISFDETTTVDRLALLSCNLKGFTAFYNGVTANTFALVSGLTTVSSFTGNTQEDLYMPITPVDCTSVTFDCKATMLANSEKAIGFLLITESLFSFPRIPAANNYTPLLVPKEYKHELSDGGTRTHRVTNKWNHRVKFTYIDQDFRDDLLDVYNRASPVTFVPFGTTTGWDGVCYEANWTGPFEFYKLSDNASSAGYTGQIQLNQT